MRRTCRAAALALASAGALLAALGCGGDEASRPPAAPPWTRAPAPPAPAPAPPPAPPPAPDAAFETPYAGAGGGSSRLDPPPARGSLAEPSFGTGPVKPADVHPFRLAASLRSMRASASGVKILKMMSVVPDVMDAKARTGVDPFADGEWLLVYGSKAEVPGPNANLVKHVRPDAEVTRALADGGFEPLGTSPGAASISGTAGAVRGELFGVRDAVVRPQSGLMALVPLDRAHDLAAALAKPAVDPGVPPGAIARMFIAEPSKIARFLPAFVVRAVVVVKAAGDGGLDATGDADCPDAASCKATAASLDELVKRQNSMVVRIVSKNLLGGLVLRAEGAKLKATLHASPEQVDAMLGLIRAQAGLPGADPGDQTHR